MKSAPDKDLMRDVRRVLRAMDEEDGRLKRITEGAFALVDAQGLRRRAMDVSAQSVKTFSRRGWVRIGEDGLYALTPAGQGVVRRLLARERPFSAQHAILETRRITEDDGTERFVTVNEAESPLGWLYKRKAIDAVQLAAGERLRRDFTIAQLTPRLAVDLSAPSMGGRRGMKTAPPLSDTVIAAKQRFGRALAAVGPGLSDLLFHVCCHLSGLEDCERALGWPQRAAKVVLVLGLDRLAEHYGMRVAAPLFGRIRGWQAE
ncbi:MAG: hypothetical protein GC166_00405 [Alphaproteobacteria bacterium]|nr:hypothetical protein [Alphaproteobacteria bacterium]